MNQVELQLLYALKAFMKQEPAEIALESLEDWMELYKLSMQHSIFPIVYDVLYGSFMTLDMPKDSLMGLQRGAMMEIVQQAQKTRRFLDLYKELNKGNIKALVVKGLICRNIYPKSDCRISGDEDLYIREEQFQECHESFLNKGMIVIDGDMEKGQVVTYGCPQTGLHIELHRKLFSEESKAYGKLNRAFDHVFDHAIQIKIDGTSLWTMEESEHMLYLIFHSFKHFLHSGFGIRQVCDIGRFAEAYGQKIDWAFIKEQTKSFRADIFAVNLFEIGRNYLKFSYEAGGELYQFMNEYKEVIDCDELLNDIFSAGIYGKSSESRVHSSLITLSAVSDEGGSKSGNVLRAIFPSASELKGRYAFLEKAPILLPAAWVHRLVVYLTRQRGQKDNSMMESIEIGNHRVEIMKKYKIIKE
ncbi:MAG: nucleotidyltransferase family protein [Lachnospiraceae bacterium]|nr:nucleotidyltransferase family protein [Lachnospiraceae bacterium]